MKKNIFYIILALSITSAYLFAGSIALSELPRSAVAFAEKYFPDNYLYRAMEMGGSYTLIFKGGLKIFVDSARDTSHNEVSLAAFSPLRLFIYCYYLPFCYLSKAIIVASDSTAAFVPSL